MNVQEGIRRYLRATVGEHNRHRSWEYCYAFFRQHAPTGSPDLRDLDALQLGFYLASWGMYRGSSFLLRHAYTVHRTVVDCVWQERFSPLWQNEFGSGRGDDGLTPRVEEAVAGIAECYRSFGAPTDALITKVILGTFGCLPACDLYFVGGFRASGNPFHHLNRMFIKRVLQFCHANLRELREEQASIEADRGIRLPLMKLVDMYFHQAGWPPGQNTLMEE